MAHTKPSSGTIKPAAKRLTRATTAPVAGVLGTIVLPPSITTPTSSALPPAAIAPATVSVAPINPPGGGSSDPLPVHVPAPMPLGDLFGSVQAITRATPVSQGDPIAPAGNMAFNPVASIPDSLFLQDLRMLVDSIGAPNVTSVYFTSYTSSLSHGFEAPATDCPPIDPGKSVSSAKSKQPQKPISPTPGPSQLHSIPDMLEYFKRQMIGDGVHKTNKKDLQILIDQIVGHVTTELSLNRARHHEIMDLLENHSAQILDLACNHPTASDGNVALDITYNDMASMVQDLQSNMSSAVVHITNLNVRFTRLESLLTLVLTSLGHPQPTLSAVAALPAVPLPGSLLHASTASAAVVLAPASAVAAVAPATTDFAQLPVSSPPVMVEVATAVSSPPILGGSAQAARPPCLGPAPAAPAMPPAPKKQKREFKGTPGSVVVTISNVTWLTDVTGGMRSMVNKVMGSVADPILMRSTF
ncbi:uncharacterized protein ARMOST_12940 [Armillaria ostoyae]|uniref:Uncharacterized protein n=1 Tax=Armillaria ostoyae TaxID=47428 RepID=A0A284RLD5_ARMOS|nr:uncharacterized protein ARMOST_12939 [Armillaria ostoyae]SJL09560.1 uncharacterized protein ARMOST_12940 [Armillaria ostoyae]